MTAPETFALHAVRYGHVGGRAPHESFISPDPHEGGEAMDFFVWAAVGPDHVYVIDSGYGEDAARRRGRTFVQHPVEGLRRIGVDAATVRDVVITHLHYDHVGNFDHFPAARFHLQDKEMLFATGRHMAHASMARAYEVDEVPAPGGEVGVTVEARRTGREQNQAVRRCQSTGQIHCLLQVFCQVQIIGRNQPGRLEPGNNGRAVIR